MVFMLSVKSAERGVAIRGECVDFATVEAVMLETMLELRSKNYEVERVTRKITQTGLARLAGGIMAPKK
jgi:hypothetical protein